MWLTTICQRNPGEWTILIELKCGDADRSKIDGVRLGSIRTGYFNGIDDRKFQLLSELNVDAAL